MKSESDFNKLRMPSINSKTGLENMEGKPKIYVEDKYNSFLPLSFRNNPVGYIEQYGENIKSGEIEYHRDGSVSEDPTAAKFLPEWENNDGEMIEVVSKRVNPEKVKTRTEKAGEKIEDSLLEFKMMSLCQILDLPSAKPVGFVNHRDVTYNLMEKVDGYTWTQRDKEKLGLASEDEKWIQDGINKRMRILKERFEEFGIYRRWKHQDMVFNLDIENKKVADVVPVDWERSYLDKEKLMQKVSDLSLEGKQRIENIILLKI